jgi:hypothetical protein
MDDMDEHPLKLKSLIEETVFEFETNGKDEYFENNKF